MRCPKCFAENPDTSRFCNNCGSSFGAEEEPEFEPTRTLRPPVQAIPSGTLIAGKYRISEEIGRGGMGIVYKAEDRKLRRTVALKFLPQQWISDAESKERFIHEAQAASALDHPNICTIYEIEETEDGRMYIAMAFYEGESLRERIRREPLNTNEAVLLASQIAQGMAKAHHKGIVHRDIKPANILITTDGVAKVVDFGLAKLAGQVKLTREGTTIGTVAYMSPEQARGDALDLRTDIWSLGVVLYEMLAGQLPFKGELEQPLIHSILKSEPEPITKFRQGLPAGIPQIIAKALQKNSGARYQTMDELQEDLNAVSEGLRPLRAKAGLVGGRILGLRKIYVYAGLTTLAILAALALLLINPRQRKIYDSLAVLPIENLSKDSEADFPIDALTSEIIQKFYAVGSLRTLRLQAVMDYRNTKKSYRQIGQELNVKAILDANMQRFGRRVRISGRLIDAATELPLWTGTYDKDAADILALETELAQAIVLETRVKLMPQEEAALAALRTASKKVDARAYDLYLRAKKAIYDLGNDPSAERWQTAYKDIQRAIAIDPNFAATYWLLSQYYMMGYVLNLLTYTDALGKAEAALERGLSLDSDSGEAHKASGLLKNHKWDWEGAKKEYERAAELSPGDPEPHALLSGVNLYVGRFEEAVSGLKRAIQIDPSIDPEGGALAECLGNIGRYDEAIAILQQSIQANPKNPRHHLTISWVYAAKGLYAEAVVEAKTSLDLLSAPNKTYFDLMLVIVHAWAGHKKEAQILLDEYLIFQKGKPVESFMIAEIYSLLGEKDKAFEWLDRAIQDHAYMMIWLKIDKALDNIRADPRFKEYLKKAGFER